MANMKDIIDDSTPEKKKMTWKAKPRRSLGIASSDEWNRYIDAFDIPEQPNTKGKWTKKQIRNVTATNNNSKPKSKYFSIKRRYLVNCKYIHIHVSKKEL